ncbi:failed axon connections homolog isoform X2 [Ptychodera flava]|uniref:failed axon connections homolog isoform X2 n=1 Tax=Ptychodera flava TaxID=63121 RepID=UPI00396A15D5
MVAFLESLYHSQPGLFVVACSVIIAATVYVVLFQRSSRPGASVAYPKDTVILCGVRRWRDMPCLFSPFPLKLETYLKFAKIPYKVALGKGKGPKGKIPWIEYNGLKICDSNLIIEFLNEEFKIDLNKNLNPEERAVGRAFQKMAEENMFWGHAYWLFRQDHAEWPSISAILKMTVKYLIFPFVRRKLKKQMYGHGIGRHTEQELFSIVKKDLRALSTFLGEKKFLFGNEPCEYDCAIFGQLAQQLWCFFPGSPQKILMKGDLKNLEKYCQLMKEKFWPDWEQCILGNEVPITSLNLYNPADPHILKEK